MTTLLYIEASPRKNRSHSGEIADAFLDAYLNHHPDHKIKLLNVWRHDLPELTGETVKAVYAAIQQLELNHHEEKEWKKIKELTDEFKNADKYLFSVPMWNFSIPYRLKHYLDVIVQPGLTYKFSKEKGYHGLVSGKPVAVICSRGGEYVRQAQKLDMQQPYLEQVLRFIGFSDIHHITVQPTLDSTLFATMAAVNEGRDQALAEVARIAASF